MSQSNLFDISLHTSKNDSDKYFSEFQTPPEICDYMVSLLPVGAQTILEPTPGDGNIVSALKKVNYKNITAPDDFFLSKFTRYDAVVMNPPFSSKYANMLHAPMGIGNKKGMKLGYYILTECMQLSNVVIALMPWFTLSDSDVRLRYLKRFGMRSLTALPRKTFEYARIQTVVIHLEKGYKGSTEFKVYDLISGS